jgi:Icc-related predicted phosphoesterase
MSKYKITLISDTHCKHGLLTPDLPGGDLLIHAGDISSMGYEREIESFCWWFSQLNHYKHKIFIAGNHDWGFEDNVDKVKNILSKYPEIKYLQDDAYIVSEGDYQISLKIWGSPWQPRFYNWAFNADRGEDIKQYWDLIPNDIDILITHGPAYGFLDRVNGKGRSLGCEELTKALERINPYIHVCGHIHSGNGYEKYDNTHLFNAAVLDESYMYNYRPKSFEWNKQTNEIIYE